jgi:hypothetical protein
VSSGGQAGARGLPQSSGEPAQGERFLSRSGFRTGEQQPPSVMRCSERLADSSSHCLVATNEGRDAPLGFRDYVVEARVGKSMPRRPSPASDIESSRASCVLLVRGHSARGPCPSRGECDKPPFRYKFIRFLDEAIEVGDTSTTSGSQSSTKPSTSPASKALPTRTAGRPCFGYRRLHETSRSGHQAHGRNHP